MPKIGEPYVLTPDGSPMEAAEVVEGEEAVEDAMEQAEAAFKECIEEGSTIMKRMLGRVPGGEDFSPTLAADAVDLLISHAKDLGALEQMRRTIGQISRGEPLILQMGMPTMPGED